MKFVNLTRSQINVNPCPHLRCIASLCFIEAWKKGSKIRWLGCRHLANHSSISIIFHLVLIIVSLGAWQNDVNTCIVLPGTHPSAMAGACVWSLDTYIPLPIYHFYVLFVDISYQAWFCLQISSPAILFDNVNGMFKSEFYCSCPSAGNKQSIHIINFPARQMRLNSQMTAE